VHIATGVRTKDIGSNVSGVYFFVLELC